MDFNRVIELLKIKNLSDEEQKEFFAIVADGAGDVDTEKVTEIERRLKEEGLEHLMKSE